MALSSDPSSLVTTVHYGEKQKGKNLEGEREAILYKVNKEDMTFLALKIWGPNLVGSRFTPASVTRGQGLEVVSRAYAVPANLGIISLAFKVTSEQIFFLFILGSNPVVLEPVELILRP